MILGALASSMVLNLMPAVALIAEIKVENPESVRAIAQALGAIMGAMADMMGAIGIIMHAT